MSSGKARIKCVYGDDNRVICVSKDITYEQFLKQAEEEFGFPVVVYRYIDPYEGDSITVKNDATIDLAYILSIPISKPQTYDLKVFVKNAQKTQSNPQGTNPPPSSTNDSGQKTDTHKNAPLIQSSHVDERSERPTSPVEDRTPPASPKDFFSSFPFNSNATFSSLPEEYNEVDSTNSISSTPLPIDDTSRLPPTQLNDINPKSISADNPNKPKFFSKAPPKIDTSTPTFVSYDEPDIMQRTPSKFTLQSPFDIDEGTSSTPKKTPPPSPLPESPEISMHRVFFPPFESSEMIALAASDDERENESSTSLTISGSSFPSPSWKEDPRSLFDRESDDDDTTPTVALTLATSPPPLSRRDNTSPTKKDKNENTKTPLRTESSPTNKKLNVKPQSQKRTAKKKTTHTKKDILLNEPSRIDGLTAELRQRRGSEEAIHRADTQANAQFPNAVQTTGVRRNSDNITFRKDASDPTNVSSLNETTSNSLIASSSAPAQSISNENNTQENKTDDELDSVEDDLIGILSKPNSWKLGALIGQGAFGKVYQGLVPERAEIIAVKEMVLPEHIDSKAEQQLKAFQKEEQLLKTLKHPNIVTFLGSQQIGNKIYIFLEYVTGGSISSTIHKFGPLPEVMIKRYAKQILLGLEYLHQNNIVHRDIKGANVLVSTKGVAKLADFGASKGLLTKDHMLHSMSGTPYWMAPEVINQQGHGTAADIWSFGCTLIEMAQGKPPWADEFTHPAPLFMAVGNSERIPQIPSHLSPHCKDLLLQCFKRNPAERPTATQLLNHAWFKSAVPLLPQNTNPSLSSSVPSSPPFVQPHQNSSASLSPSPSNLSPISLTSQRKIEATTVTAASLSLAFVKPSFESLPKEVALHSFSFLNIRDLLNALVVCKYWNTIAHNNFLWRKLCLRTWRKLRWQHRNRKTAAKLQQWNTISDLSLTSTLEIEQLNEDDLVEKGRWRKFYVELFSNDMKWHRKMELFPTVHLKGHNKPINTITFLQKGKRLLSASEDKKIKVWDLLPSTPTSKRKILRNNPNSHSFKGHTAAVTCLAVHDNEKIFFSGSVDKSVKIWDLETRSRRFLRSLDGHENAVTSLFFDRQTDKLLSASLDTTVRLWDIEKGVTTAILRGHKKGVTVVRSPSNCFVTVGGDGQMKFWDSRTSLCIKTIELHQEETTCLEVVGDTILTAATDGNVKEWSLKGELRSSFSAASPEAKNTKEKIWALKFDGINTLFAVSNISDSGILRLWDYNREKCFSEATVKSHLIRDIDLNTHHLPELNNAMMKLQIPVIPTEQLLVTAGTGIRVWSLCPIKK
jgi:serine/threonine protein kinase